MIGDIWNARPRKTLEVGDTAGELMSPPTGGPLAGHVFQVGRWGQSAADSGWVVGVRVRGAKMAGETRGVPEREFGGEA